ncbi:hypothetical protein D3C78_1813200 [compost metagenome]
MVQFIRAIDGGAPGHQAKAAVLGRQQQLQLSTLAAVLAEQAMEGVQGLGGGLAALGDKAQAAQPLLFLALEPGQADALGAKHGDETIRRQM